MSDLTVHRELIAGLQEQLDEALANSADFEATSKSPEEWAALVEQARSLPGTDEDRARMEMYTLDRQASAAQTRSMNTLTERVIRMEMNLLALSARVQELEGEHQA